uniref:Uncharacterized protein n=1 Tax=Tanacetum cinerariifolium TaxID=118510 RepID=A0A6L2JMR8_TANCI|nr:hypothetical protein [Tanacetum cinerariifolium]
MFAEEQPPDYSFPPRFDVYPDDFLEIEMFTEEQPPDYSFLPRFDVYPDDFLEIESDANFDDDSFNSEGEKIKEAELLIDLLDLPCDILFEYDSFNSHYFSKDDVLPSLNNEDKCKKQTVIATSSTEAEYVAAASCCGQRIEEEQATNARYWNILACCDDDDDDDSTITPVLSTEETDNSLSMGDQHLDTIPATESDEVIKSSVENLVLILSESEVIPDTMCDVHLVSNHTPLEAKDHFEIVINSNDDISSSDDDSLYNENIKCAKCGHLVNGPYCHGCALLREKLKEDLVKYLNYFQDTSESSNDSINVVNAPREPFVVKKDHGVNLPPIDECCCECGNALDGIFCQQCIYSVITPILSTEEPIDSLSIGDEHLDTIPATKSDEVIKSSVEDLVPILSESEGIPDTMCDVHLVNNSTPLEAKNHFENVINSKDDISSSDDDSLYENIEYVEALPYDFEVVSLEVAKIVTPEVEAIEDDNLLIHTAESHLDDPLTASEHVSSEPTVAAPTPLYSRKHHKHIAKKWVTPIVDMADATMIKFDSDTDSDDDPLPYAPYADWEMVLSPLGSVHAYHDMAGNTKHFTTLRELLHMVEKTDLQKLLGAVEKLYQKEESDTFALFLWGDLHVLFQSLDDENVLDFWRNQDSWRIRSWRLYPHAQVHVLETMDGRVIHMFVDVSYPLTIATLERMLKHRLEVPKLLVGGVLSMAEQLIGFIKAALLNAQSAV